MDKLTPLLMNFIEQNARPPVQAKVTEQLNSTKTDLKSTLPATIMNYLTGSSSEGGSGNAVLSQLVNSLGPSFSNALSSVTGTTIDTASDGMDTLLTNGILNIAKGVLTKSAGQEGEQGGFNFDFLSQGKEGMVNTTLAASAPVIKQVSDNMGVKISSHFPQAIGQALQQLVDQNGGSGGAMGMAAGLMSQFLGGGSATGGERAPGSEGGGSIQQMLQNFLGPKILQLIQPYLQKFEAQMTASLENELRTKVFSPDFIKSTVMGMLSGGSGSEGGGGASGAIGGLMNAFMKNSGNGQGGGGGGQAEALNALGNFASSFLKK
ncbi:hypothetical protein BGZ93_004405 [Podila epicladia]|nr:hypothetical protein BGZ92_004036 [Podila epicladia]KAG0096507.1 hypothetical protein BGZ93_004405 [Podila epicladia]